MRINWFLARHGGPDGVSLMAWNWEKILETQGHEVFFITGDYEACYYGPMPQNVEVVPSIGLGYILNEQFLNSVLSPNPNIDALVQNTEKVANEIQARLADLNIFHNLLSLRLAHPAAALGILEVIMANTERVFVNFAPDSDFERVRGLNPAYHNEFYKAIKQGCNKDNGHGPYDFPNLLHIVLNSQQKASFRDIYGIPEERIFVIPDFLYLVEPSLPVSSLDPNFIETLNENTEDIVVDKDTVYLVHPVRVVSRKRTIEALFYAHQYRKTKGNENTAVIFTHPNKDSLDYYDECIKLAKVLDVPIIYLGNIMKTRGDRWTLEYIYRNLSILNCVGIISSDLGGWENAILEMAANGIPIAVNSELVSFYPLQEKGMIMHPLLLNATNNLMNGHSPESVAKYDAQNVPEFKYFVEWVTSMTQDTEKREITVQNNYSVCYNYYSTASSEIQQKVQSLIQAITQLQQMQLALN